MAAPADSAGAAQRLTLLASPWPIDAIWRANQPGAAEAGVDLEGGGVRLQVWRAGDEAVFRALAPADVAFRDALERTERLEAAAEAAPAPLALRWCGNCSTSACWSPPWSSRDGRLLAMTCRELIDVLAEYLEQSLGGDVAAELQLHLADCAPCRAYLATYTKTRVIGAEAQRIEMPEELRVRLRQCLLGRLERP